MGLRKRQLLARSRAKNQWSQFCCDGEAESPQDGDRDGDGEDVDGNEEVWTELSATNTDLSNFIEDVHESWVEKVEIEVSNEETRWRSTGCNTNIRGVGSSRATHFRNKRKIAQLLQASTLCQPIRQFFDSVEVGLDEESLIDDEIAFIDANSGPEDEADQLHRGRHYQPYSIEALSEAIETLANSSALITRNKSEEDNVRLESRWCFLVSLAILRYMQLLRASEIQQRVESSLQVASIMFGKRSRTSYKSKCIRLWGHKYITTGQLPVYRQGRHGKTPTIITDEDVQEALKAHLRQMSDEKRTPHQFMQDLNQFLLQEFNNAPPSVCVETARRWMVYLGFCYKKLAKGYYTDEHNRADVVQYRQEEFLPLLQQLEERMETYDGDNMQTIIEPELHGQERKVVLITQDESTFYANDGKSFLWLMNGAQKLKPKTNGSSLMISAFICPCHGIMKSQIDQQRMSYLVFFAGKNRDGWFTNDDLATQLRDTVIPIAEELHPNCELWFAFDNSQSHHKAPTNGLDASKLPLKCGGLNAPTMRDGYYYLNGQRINQRMVHEDGRPKGLRQILLERQKWRPNMVRLCTYCKHKVPHNIRATPEHGVDPTHPLAQDNCCAWHTLSIEPDFLHQRELLREILEDKGHHILYYPKFHCELNYIEKVWGYVKARTRALCDYTPSGLKEAVPGIVEQVPIAFIRRVFRKCMRFADGYQRGLQGPLLEYASKKFSSHRRIPAFVMDELEADFQRWTSVKNERALKRKKA